MALPTTADQIRAKPAVDGIDPNVRIPRAITAQGERADAIQRQATGQAEPPVTADSNDPAPTGDPPPDTPSADVEPLQPQDWERRFKGLQGRYDSDVRKVRESLGQMSDDIRRLQAENATLRSVVPQPTPPELQAQSLLSPQEIQDYGEEFVDVSRRIAREIATPLQAEIASLRAQLGAVQQETGNSFMQRMDRDIGAVVKDWQALNRDPRFMEWVKLPDVFSGAIRQELMQAAWNAGDARRVSAFFQAFLAEEAAVDPRRANGQMRQPGFNRTVTPTPSTVLPPDQGPALALEDLAAPGRAQSAGGQPAEKPVYTSADITRFYTDVKLGRWRGREQQQAAVDADIMAAQREGRIITDQRSVLPHDPRAPQR
jgi:hypothetical protein